jgi:Protein of unknown function (DUF5661)
MYKIIKYKNGSGIIYVGNKALHFPELITVNQALYIAKKLGIKFSKKRYSIQDWVLGMNIEMEHGKKYPKTNVTNDNLLMTGKIALVHINEKSNYYPLLVKYVEGGK